MSTTATIHVSNKYNGAYAKICKCQFRHQFLYVIESVKLPKRKVNVVFHFFVKNVEECKVDPISITLSEFIVRHFVYNV